MSVCARLVRFSAIFALALAFALPLQARADDTPVFKLVIKDHKFQPETIEVPAGQKFEIEVTNQDPTPEEFESKVLHRERVIKGGGTATVKLGPLKPGSYPFVGEFHESTARGTIVAK